MKKCALYFLLSIVSWQVHSQTAESAYKAGKLLKDNGKTKDAIIEFKKALQLDPISYKSMYELGWCYNDTKDYKLSQEYLKKVRPYWKDVPKVFFELAYAFEKTMQIDSAKENYKKCLDLKPDYKLAYKQLAFLDFDEAKYTESLTLLEKYLQLDSTGSNNYLVFYRKGFAENATKRFSDALVSLQKSAKLKQDYINTFLELGYAYTKLKQGPQAIYSFTQANKLDTKNHIPYNGIGEVYRDIYKKADSAIYWYKQSLGVKPKERKANFGIGYCLNTKEKFAEAIPYLQEAIAQENTYSAAYVELGYSLFKTGKSSDALLNFDKAISLSPTNENARFYKGLLYINNKDRVKAQQMVDELKKLASKNASLLQEKVNKM